MCICVSCSIIYIIAWSSLASSWRERWGGRGGVSEKSHYHCHLYGGSKCTNGVCWVVRRFLHCTLIEWLQVFLTTNTVEELVNLKSCKQPLTHTYIVVLICDIMQAVHSYYSCECRDWSVAPVVIKWWKVLFVDNLITRNLSCQCFDNPPQGEIREPFIINYYKYFSCETPENVSIV